MKKFLLVFVLSIVSAYSVMSAQVTQLNDNQAYRLNGSSPAARYAGLGTALQGIVENTVSNTEGVGNLVKLAVANYTYSDDYDTFLIIDSYISPSDTTISVAGHGLITGDVLDFDTSVTGGTEFFSVASELVKPDSVFYTIRVNANSFKLASSRANALTGTALTITDAGTGTMTVNINRTGDIDLGVDLPDNAIVVESYIEPVSTVTGCSITISVVTATSNDVYAGASSFTGGTMIRGLQSKGSETILKTTAASPIIISPFYSGIKTSSLNKITAGEFNVYLVYVQGE